MKTKKKLLAVGAVVACCITIAWYSTSIQGGQKTYEIQPQITLPEYRTDTAWAINAYERMMERYMDQAERNATVISADIKGITKKLDSIDDKLTELSARIARIEKTFGIIQPKTPAKEQAKPKVPDKKGQKESLPPR